jgi:hypothetical protein
MIFIIKFFRGDLLSPNKKLNRKFIEVNLYVVEISVKSVCYFIMVYLKSFIISYC